MLSMFDLLWYYSLLTLVIILFSAYLIICYLVLHLFQLSNCIIYFREASSDILGRGPSEASHITLFTQTCLSADSCNFGIHVPKDDIPLSIQWLFQRSGDASMRG